MTRILEKHATSNVWLTLLIAQLAACGASRPVQEQPDDSESTEASQWPINPRPKVDQEKELTWRQDDDFEDGSDGEAIRSRRKTYCKSSLIINGTCPDIRENEPIDCKKHPAHPECYRGENLRPHDAHRAYRLAASDACTHSWQCASGKCDNGVCATISDKCVAQTEITPLECHVLDDLADRMDTALYTDYANEGRSAHRWQSSTPICQREGVTCHNGHVRALDLSAWRVKLRNSGPYFTLAALKHLEEIDLGTIFLDFTGENFPPPNFARQDSLRSITIRGVLHRLPASWRSLPNLRKLVLLDSALASKDIERLDQFQRLENISISVNYSRSHFRGKVTALNKIDIRAFEGLRSLRHLHLLSENFVGYRAEFSIFPQLATLDIAKSGLEVKLEDLSRLSNLKTLTLPRAVENKPSGVTSGDIKSLDKLSKLESLTMGGASLKGTLTDSAKWLPKIKKLAITDTKIKGDAARIFPLMRQLEKLAIAGSPFSDNIASALQTCGQLTSLTAGGNQQASFKTSDLAKLSSLTELRLHHTKLKGPIRKIATALPNLRQLALSHVQLRGRIDSSLKNLQHLEILDLSGNQLSGTLPPFLSALEALNTLDLSDNKLKGTPPADVFLLPNIKEINLSKNRLSGPLPEQAMSIRTYARLYLCPQKGKLTMTPQIRSRLGNRLTEMDFLDQGAC